jgi:hypothetical protein
MLKAMTVATCSFALRKWNAVSSTFECCSGLCVCLAMIGVLLFSQYMPMHIFHHSPISLHHPVIGAHVQSQFKENDTLRKGRNR